VAVGVRGVAVGGGVGVLVLGVAVGGTGVHVGPDVLVAGGDGVGPTLVGVGVGGITSSLGGVGCGGNLPGGVSGFPQGGLMKHSRPSLLTNTATGWPTGIILRASINTPLTRTT